MSNICEFVNKQNHVRKNDGSLDNARTIAPTPLEPIPISLKATIIKIT